MKKIIVVLGLLLFVNVNTVEATDFEDSFAGIAVFVDNTSGTNIDGHIDLLVLRSDFEDEITTGISGFAKIVFPNYEEFDYLDDTEWISYCAYVEDANCHYNAEYDFFEFATSKDEYKRLDDIKFIHVDSSGNTVVVSDIYNVPNPLFFQDFSNLSYYDETTNEFQSDMSIEMDDVISFVFIVVLFFACLFAGIRTVAAYMFRLDFNRKVFIFPYFVIIYITLFILGYIALSSFDFIQSLVDGMWSLMVYLALLSLIEIAVSYFLLFRKENKEKHIKFVVYSYGSMVLIFMILVSGILGISLF